MRSAGGQQRGLARLRAVAQRRPSTPPRDFISPYLRAASLFHSLFAHGDSSVLILISIQLGELVKLTQTLVSIASNSGRSS